MSRKPLAECRVAKVPVHPSLLLAPLALIFWVVLLAGAGATHRQCTKRQGSDSYCNAQFGLVWATVFFELISLVAMFGLLPTRFGSGVRVLFAAMFTIPTTLLMGHAHDAVVRLDGMDGTVTSTIDAFGVPRTYKISTPSDLKSAYQTAAAGSTMMVICNLLLIIYLLVEVPECDSCSTAVVKDTKAAQPTPAAPAAPAAPAQPVEAVMLPPV